MLRRPTQLNLHATSHKVSDEFLVRIGGHHHSLGVIGIVVQSEVPGICVASEPFALAFARLHMNNCLDFYCVISALLDAFEYQSGEHPWTHEAPSPLIIPGRCGLRGDDFIEGSTLLLEGRYLVASANQQVAVESKLGLVPDRTMPWNNDCVVRDFGQVSFGGLDHSVNAAAS